MSTKLIEQARALGDQRGLASDLSATLRLLDRLEKRTGQDARSAVALATMVVNLQGIKQSLAKLPKSTAPEVRAFYQSEFKTLDKGVSNALRQYVLSTGDHRPSTLGLQGFARKVLADYKADQDAAAARKATRTTPPQPVAPKRGGTAASKGKASRAGRCAKCRQMVNYVTTAGVCNDCLSAMMTRSR